MISHFLIGVLATIGIITVFIMTFLSMLGGNRIPILLIPFFYIMKFFMDYPKMLWLLLIVIIAIIVANY